MLPKNIPPENFPNEEAQKIFFILSEREQQEQVARGETEARIGDYIIKEEKETGVRIKYLVARFLVDQEILPRFHYRDSHSFLKNVALCISGSEKAKDFFGFSNEDINSFLKEFERYDLLYSESCKVYKNKNSLYTKINNNQNQESEKEREEEYEELDYQQYELSRQMNNLEEGQYIKKITKKLKEYLDRKFLSSISQIISDGAESDALSGEEGQGLTHITFTVGNSEPLMVETVTETLNKWAGFQSSTEHSPQSLSELFQKISDRFAESSEPLLDPYFNFDGNIFEYITASGLNKIEVNLSKGTVSYTKNINDFSGEYKPSINVATGIMNSYYKGLLNQLVNSWNSSNTLR